MTPVKWQRVEAAAAAVLIFAACIRWGFGWWWLLAVFLAFDLSMLGYLRGTRVGAFCYNLVHNYAGPSLVLAASLLGTGHMLLLKIGLAWAFHVAIDRGFGYGLKHDDGFDHTHLGTIGRGDPGNRP